MPGDTTTRGYGHQHQRARKAALKALRDGDPCTRCHQPMWRAQAAQLDLDHTEDRGAYAGLAHATCNRAAGARKRNRQRTTTPPVTRYSRQW